jgi:branched-chain amino acid transport system permease protein
VFVLTTVIYLARFVISTSTLFGMVMFIILAQAVNLLFGFTGYLPLGLGAFFGVGAYAFAILVSTHNWGILPAMLAALLFSAGSGALVAPLTKLKGPYYAISSLVMQFAVSSMIVNLPQWLASNVTDISLVKIYDPDLTFVLGLAGLAIAMLIVYYIKNSKYGLAFRAIKDDEQVAAMAGVNVSRYKVAVSIVAATLAGYAGITFGWYYSFLYPESTFDITIPTVEIIIAIFGGLRTLSGPLLGAAILYNLQIYLSGILGGSLILLYVPVFAALLIVIVLFLPHGLIKVLYRYIPRIDRILE